jgi:hypothetical protein
MEGLIIGLFMGFSYLIIEALNRRGINDMGDLVKAIKSRRRPKRGLIHLKPPELQPADACKHPEESLVEVRSDVMKKGELVATLCTKCDEQLGPEVWQAIMDRKFDEWTREHQSKEEARAMMDRLNAEKAAEQAELEAVDTALLQHFLDDASQTLGTMRWGVSDAQDAKRREIAANCKKWRAELERRGVKEIPSWHRKMQEKLLPNRAPKVDAGSLYVQVTPNLDLFRQVAKELGNENAQLKERLGELQAKDHKEQLADLQATADRHTKRAAELQRQFNDWLNEKASPEDLATVAKIKLEAMLEPANVEAAGLSDWRDCGWVQVAPPVTTTYGTRLVLKQKRSGQTREFNFFSHSGAMNFLSR